MLPAHHPTGLIFFRHSPATERFITAWSDMLRADDSVWDQNAFNQLAKEGLEPMRRHSDNPRLVRRGRLRQP